jgi:hypothetical protein
MGARVAGRLLGFVGALSFALLPFSAQAIPASAATTTGTLFAITGINQSVLSRLDPATGIVTPIEDLAGSNQGQLVTMTGDPSAHRIFAVRTSVIFVPPGGISIINEVLTISSQTGAFTISQPVNVSVGQAAFDPSTGTLYVLGANGLFRVDTVTGATTSVAPLGNLCCGVLSMSLVPGAHTIYVNNDNPGFGGPPSDQILTVDTAAGTAAASPQVATSVRIVTYDTSAGGLFGVTDCCPRQIVKIDPATAAETPTGTISTDPGLAMTFALAVDPATHTAFMDLQTSPTPLTTQDEIVSVNDQTGAFSVSPPATDTVSSMYFETPVVITPESIKADVRSALASGAITNAGVASSLLAKLNAAETARSRGQCMTAGNDYRAFIAEVNALRGKMVAAATANQLMSEARFLVTNCP